MIYKYICVGCDYVYVRQTKRDLNSRKAENKRAIKFQRTEAALCECGIFPRYDNEMMSSLTKSGLLELVPGEFR